MNEQKEYLKQRRKQFSLQERLRAMRYEKGDAGTRGQGDAEKTSPETLKECLTDLDELIRKLMKR